MKKIQTKVTKVYEVDGVNYASIQEANVAIAVSEIADLVGSKEVATLLVDTASDATKREVLLKALKLLNVRKPLAPRKKVVKADAKTKTTKV
jgi:hypothetical protein